MTEQFQPELLDDSDLYTYYVLIVINFLKKILKIPKGGNQNPYIEEEQTTQWPKDKGQRTINKTYI